MYYIEKHVIRLGFQSVLNRKACYTPRFPRCITSKSMLYNPIFAKFSLYNMFFSPISGIFYNAKFRWYTSKSNCIKGRIALQAGHASPVKWCLNEKVELPCKLAMKGFAREMVSNCNVGATTYTVCWVGTDRRAARLTIDP